MSVKEKKVKKVKSKKEKDSVKDPSELYYEAAAKELTKEKRTKIFLAVGFCLIVAVSGFAALIDSQDGEAAGEAEAVVYVSNREKNIVKNGGEYTVAVPELYLPEDFAPELTAEQVDYGFIGVKLNDNGSASYRIDSRDYKRYVSDLELKTKTAIEAMPSTENYPSVKSVKCNDDFTKVTVTVDRSKYEGSWDNLVLYDSFELIGYLQAMQGYAASGIEASYSIVDSADGKEYSTVDFPEALNQNF
ncbi:MAG: hypothetical protein PUB20_04190 [Clostridia bacterium]|nr:hypothetical protein [Clostridia bacterium]